MASSWNRIKSIMAVERISCADDPRVADYRDVPDPELVRSRGLFVAEGRLVVRRVIEDGRCRVRSLLVSEAARRALEPAIAALAPDVQVYVCEPADFHGIAGYDVHRGCLALVERPPPLSTATLLASARMLVVVEGVTNADNIGGVFRNAAAFGAGGVLLSPACCDPLYRKAIRTSMAAVIRVPFARAADWPGALQHVRAAGFSIVALTPRQPADTLDAFASRPRPGRLALMVGTEGDGLTPAAEAIADHRVRIPIAGEVDSLNLAVAVGIALYRLTR
jgi:tRNA G18 (ribose-2'-O)-methylase SpoU